MNFIQKTYLYLSISLLILIAGFSMLAMNAFRLTELRRNISDNEYLLNEVRQMNVSLLQAESAMRGYYLVNNEWYLNNYHSSIEEYNRVMAMLEKETPKQPHFKTIIGEMKLAAQNRIDRLNQGMEIFSTKGLQGGLAFVQDGKGKILMDRFRDQSRKLEKNIANDTAGLQRRIEKMASANRWSMIFIGLIAAGLLVFLSLYFVRSERKMVQMNEELREKNNELDQFARVTSHDLQEPLRMTRSFLLLLEKKYKPHLDEHAQEYIFRAADGAERMQQLIVNLLAYARAGKTEMNFESVPLDALLEEVRNDLQPLISENNAVIHLEKLPAVWGDKTHLFRLFLNLVGNSVKFRKKEEPPVIHISAETKGGKVFIHIRDNGIGIPAAFQHKLFAPFVRLHSSSDYKGTGLGLATCKKIAELHDGSLTVVSEEGKGSVFTVALGQGQPAHT